MLSQSVQDAINRQIQAELYSAYIYLSMSAYCEDQNLAGFANWMRMQWEEEIVHAMKLYDFVHDRDGRVLLEAIGKPESEFGTPLEIMQKTLAHERKVTKMIHDLFGLASSENDYATASMLKWFVDEQVEEEKNASDLVSQLELAGDSKAALLMIDARLGERVPEAEGE